VLLPLVCGLTKQNLSKKQKKSTKKQKLNKIGISLGASHEQKVKQSEPFGTASRAVLKYTHHK
jgi:hypothetical protein